MVGDPFCATTHSDLQVRATKLGIRVKAIHNASIINSVGITGLQLYSFGHIVSVPFFTEKWRPYSFISKVERNFVNKLHTLVLLDIRVKEISDENLMKGKKIYEPPSFMSVNVALEQIKESLENGDYPGLDLKDLKFYGVARIGAEDQKILSGSFEELVGVDFGKPLHSVLICGPEMHEIEETMYKFYHVSNQPHQMLKKQD